jgi:lia operon protein LiaG
MKRLVVAAVLLITAISLFAFGQRESGDFGYAGTTALEVEAETFAVEIRATRTRRVEMQVENAPNGYTVYHSTDDGAVRVWVERTFSLFSRPHRGRLVFIVPSDIDVSVDTSTGEVYAAGLTGDAVAIETSTGSVLVEGFTNGARVRSTTGSIDIRRSEGDYVVRSTTGSIAITSVNGDLEVSSSTGRQRYQEVIGDIDARSTTGRIELSDTEGRLRLRTSTGRQIGTGVLLAGNSSFDSTTGDIEMDLANDVDALEFDLSSTTGSLRVASDRSQRELFVSGTGFTVTGSTSTGSQHFF